MKRLRERDWPKARALAAGSAIVREFTAAGAASRWLEVSIVRHDVEPGSPPQTISQPLRRRFRAESDHALCHVSRQHSWDLKKRRRHRRVGYRPAAAGGLNIRPSRHGNILAVPITDTSPSAQALQLQIQRAMPGEQRLLLALEMSLFARELAKERIRREYPEWSDAQVARELVRLTFLPAPVPARLR